MSAPQRRIVGWLCALASLVLVLGGVSAGQSGATLTNEDVVRMVRAQLSTRVIITTIESSEAEFDVSPSGLIGLKEAGVSDELVEVMQTRMRGLARAAAAAPPTTRPPEQSEHLVETRDPATILRTFKTMYVDASEAQFFGPDQVKAALAKNKGFAPLNVTIVEDRAFADVVLKVAYTFAWDYPFTLTHQNSTIVLLSGKGSGPFSGPKGASSVANELVKALKRHR